MTVTLLTRSNVRDICAALHINPTKTLGQNFVHDGGTVRKIIKAANIEPGEHVLEVGPGLGSLTLGLLEAQAKVSAVEIDPVLATALPATVVGHGGSELRVLRRDALKVRTLADLQQASPATAEAEYEGETDPWGPPTKLVANLPYNVAVPLVLNVLEHFPTITELLVMVQSEVAQRLAAEPGGRIYGVPSVKVAWYGKATLAGNISRNIFWPTPHVDSALVRIQRYLPGQSPLTDCLAENPTAAGVSVTREDVFALIDLAFAQRRKTLRACLKNWAGSTVAAENILQQAQIDPLRRGETLTINEFIALTAAAAQVKPQ
ncbi:MAG: 16S rRNA (adenine(1518)-N(6)/adenine(1519)-N(6))-dimethyltransferase RsmA [Actinomycetaceae bacterium]|nr:16S rRNA (adenine(1518)-N(6)/adenine(1519)-N(6))-dimethyltransferase RsmA [Actinomycetaceae bacterium]